jgi:2-polyprenyl-6-methoxyphenol hydroxylase-like FAD-dependent oxidoreductase
MTAWSNEAIGIAHLLMARSQGYQTNDLHYTERQIPTFAVAVRCCYRAAAMTSDIIYDVLVAGYGPTGMLAAIRLARAGHRVAVLERYTTLYNLPRVGIVHDDIMRMFQELGCWDAVRPATHFLPVYELARNGRILMSNEVAPLATHGWPEMISVYQPAFEAELDRLARAEPNVSLFQGETVVALTQSPDSIEVTTADQTGARRTYRGRYLIGADGGNSFVREALGVPYENLGFDQDWLVIDGRAKNGRSMQLPQMRQLCEPEQPGMTMQMGPSNRRWSFMVLPGESKEEAVRPENVWKRLNRAEGGTPDDFELVRVVTYRFTSLLAERWRDGRVFLAGDAAHQMPPFLAQGLCSGFRDAYNLAWKLDLVLKGQAPDAFLDTYEAERGPNARATIIESARVGQNVIERDLEKAARRDETLLALHAEMLARPKEKALIAFRVPGYDGGFVAPNATGAGDAFPQGTVRLGQREGLFDDLAGRGLLIVSRHQRPEATLPQEYLEYWRGLGGGFAHFGTDELQDTGGVYSSLMDEYGCDVLVKRPDYYLFAAVPTAAELPALLDDFRQQLSVTR